MKEGIVKRTKNTIKAKIDVACPLTWLVEHYPKYKGKLVEIDDTFLGSMKSDADVSKTTRKGGMSLTNMKWKAGIGVEGVPFPETKVTVEKYGCRSFLTKVIAEDIPDFGFIQNPTDSQILFLQPEIESK